MRSPNTYLEKMKKTMNKNEKLFFLEHINIRSYDIIVDFGCADGALLNALDSLVPEDAILFCAVDNQFRPKISRPHIYCQSLQELEQTVSFDEKRVLIIFSSVLHELGNNDGALQEINMWCRKHATTVVCRDMYFLEEMLTPYDIMTYYDEKREWSQLHDIYKASGVDSVNYVSNLLNYKDKLIAINNNYKNNRIAISATALLYEFFLKYTYDENWDTEVKEMYFCNNASSLFMGLMWQFNVVYRRIYTLSYKKKEVKKRFGYKMKLPTHIQYILEKQS